MVIVQRFSLTQKVLYSLIALFCTVIVLAIILRWTIWMTTNVIVGLFMFGIAGSLIIYIVRSFIDEAIWQIIEVAPIKLLEKKEGGNLISILTLDKARVSVNAYLKPYGLRIGSFGYVYARKKIIARIEYSKEGNSWIVSSDGIEVLRITNNRALYP